MTTRETYHQVAKALGRCPTEAHPDLGRLIDHFLRLELLASAEEYRGANRDRARAITRADNMRRRVA